MVDASESVNFPFEFLNSMQVTGIHSDYLKLKLASPIILLRNLDSPKLCNWKK